MWVGGWATKPIGEDSKENKWQRPFQWTAISITDNQTMRHTENMKTAVQSPAGLDSSDSTDLSLDAEIQTRAV